MSTRPPENIGSLTGRLEVALSRVANLEAGIRRLCDEATRQNWPTEPMVGAYALRALVGDETPGTGERDG